MNPVADNDDSTDVRQVLAGEISAYDRLIRRNFSFVHALGMARLLCDHDSADDLAQEVFLRAYLQLQKLEKPELFSAWIAQITRNLAADWQRKNQRRSGLITMISLNDEENIDMPSDDPSPQEEAEKSEACEQLADALNQLTADQRELLLLHFSENFSQSEIARRLRQHPSTIMRKLNRSLEQLRRIYERKSTDSWRGLAGDQRIMKRSMALVLATSLLPVVQREALAHVVEDSFTMPSAPADPVSLGVAFGSKAVMVMLAIIALGVVGTTAYDYYKQQGQSEGKITALRSDQNVFRNIDNGSSENVDLPGRKLALVSSSEPMSMQEDEGSLRIGSESNCPPLAVLRKSIRNIEEQLSRSQYLFAMSSTLAGAKPDATQTQDSEGTVTMNGRFYSIEFRVTNRANGESPIESVTALNNETISVVRYPSIAPEVMSWEKGDALGRFFNPLRVMLSSPFAMTMDDQFSDFIEDELKHGVLVTSCTRSRSGRPVVSFGSELWMATMSLARLNFPYYFKELRDKGDDVKFDREVFEVATYNGITYPSKFVRRTYGYDDLGNHIELRATTATITVLKMGEEVGNMINVSPKAGKVSQEDAIEVAPQTLENQQRALDHRNRIKDELSKRLPPD